MTILGAFIGGVLVGGWGAYLLWRRIGEEPRVTEWAFSEQERRLQQQEQQRRADKRNGGTPAA